METSEKADERLGPLLLVLTPAFMCSNMLMARASADLFPPVALAFWRWAIALLVLSLFIAPRLWKARRSILREWRELAILGGLGMGVCGAFVYIGADSTSATNIGLIYSASPLMIILLSRLFYGESLSPRQNIGVFMGLLGVLTIIARGDLQNLLTLKFTTGDLWIVGATTGWAVYSILLRHQPSELDMSNRFGATILFGVIILLPFTLWEGIAVEAPTLTWTTAGTVAFLALIAGLAAYASYAKLQRLMGASTAGLVLYMAPVYNTVLAYLLLGEHLQGYHWIGAALVLPGLWLATRKPKSPYRQLKPS